MIHSVRVIGRRSSRAVSLSAAVAARLDDASPAMLRGGASSALAVGGLVIAYVSFVRPRLFLVLRVSSDVAGLFSSLRGRAKTPPFRLPYGAAVARLGNLHASVKSWVYSLSAALKALGGLEGSCAEPAGAAANRRSFRLVCGGKLRPRPMSAQRDRCNCARRATRSMRARRHERCVSARPSRACAKVGDGRSKGLLNIVAGPLPAERPNAHTGCQQSQHDGKQ